LSTHEPFIIFSLPCPAEEGEWLCWALGLQPGSTHHSLLYTEAAAFGHESEVQE